MTGAKIASVVWNTLTLKCQLWRNAGFNSGLAEISDWITGYLQLYYVPDILGLRLGEMGRCQWVVGQLNEWRGKVSMESLGMLPKYWAWTFSICCLWSQTEWMLKEWSPFWWQDSSELTYCIYNVMCVQSMSSGTMGELVFLEKLWTTSIHWSLAKESVM